MLLVGPTRSVLITYDYLRGPGRAVGVWVPECGQQLSNQMTFRQHIIVIVIYLNQTTWAHKLKSLKYLNT